MSEAKRRMEVGDSVFVYGTLRPGEGNFRLMDGKVEILGEAQLSGASLYHLGGFPGLKLEGEGTVTGTFCKITDGSLPARLDQLEGYPRMYDREEVQTSRGRAWVYIYQGGVDLGRKIASGNWYFK